MEETDLKTNTVQSMTQTFSIISGSHRTFSSFTTAGLTVSKHEKLQTTCEQQVIAKTFLVFHRLGNPFQPKTSGTKANQFGNTHFHSNHGGCISPTADDVFMTSREKPQ